MWAHYAKNHTGVVFQFRRSYLHDEASGEFRGQTVAYAPGAIGVEEYVRAMEIYWKSGDALAMARLIYATKTRDWERESEVRFFSKENCQYLPFDELALTGIVFGDGCSKDLIHRMLDLLTGWHQPPRLFQSSSRRSTHKLCIGKYSTAQ